MIAGIEEWRSVPDAPRYDVSSLGAVRKRVNATHPERRQIVPMRLNRDKDGYLYLQINGRKWLVHRLVYAVFCGDLVDGLVVCHRDGDKTNNAPSNLLQATQRENIAHKLEHGTHQAGEKHGRALYSDKQVAEIKRAISAAPTSKTGRMKRGVRRALAEKFGVSPHLIGDLNCGKAWRHTS